VQHREGTGKYRKRSELSGNIAARCSYLLELDVAPYLFKDAALLVLAASCPLISVLKMQGRHGISWS
jgi:hypothetical protein